MVAKESVIYLADFRRESANLLTELLTDLIAHNEKYGAGAFLGKILGRMLTGEIDGDGELNPEKAQEEATLEAARGSRIGLAELNTKHEKILRRFGLTISHQESEGLRHGLPSGPISMKIDNIHSFLRSAQSIQVQNGQDGLQKAFQTLLYVVEEQIANINFQHPSPEERGLLENIDALNDSFKRTAPEIRLSRLQRFVDFKDRLEQYFVVERANLWPLPGEGFGPADWVRDITPSGLEEKWSKGLKILQEQNALGDAGVGGELRKHLIMCRQRAEEQLPTLPWPDETKEKLQQVLEKYRKELEPDIP